MVYWAKFVSKYENCGGWHFADEIFEYILICRLWSITRPFHTCPNVLKATTYFGKCWYFKQNYTISLTHWGRVTHICVSRLTITGSDNGLSPGRRQAIIWTNAGILLIWPLGTNFSENLIEILTFSFTERRLNVSSAKCRSFCVGLNVLTKPSRKEHKRQLNTTWAISDEA